MRRQLKLSLAIISSLHRGTNIGIQIIQYTTKSKAALTTNNALGQQYLTPLSLPQKNIDFTFLAYN